jgi:bacterioferritin-associated ferredoxin
MSLKAFITTTTSGERMIVCICNGLKDKDIKDICDSCKTKQEFAECLKVKMNKKSCLTCYCDLIKSFEGKDESSD